MSPRTGTHRRTGPAVGPVLGELRRERGRADGLADDVARVTAERDTYKTALEALWSLVNAGSEGDGHAACRAARERAAADQFAAGVEHGRKVEAAGRDREWDEAAGPIARGGPVHDQLEILRYGPGGREHFADPRPGDFPGIAAADPAVA